MKTVPLLPRPRGTHSVFTFLAIFLLSTTSAPRGAAQTVTVESAVRNDAAVRTDLVGVWTGTLTLDGVALAASLTLRSDSTFVREVKLGESIVADTGRWYVTRAWLWLDDPAKAWTEKVITETLHTEGATSITYTPPEWTEKVVIGDTVATPRGKAIVITRTERVRPVGRVLTFEGQQLLVLFDTSEEGNLLRRVEPATP